MTFYQLPTNAKDEIRSFENQIGDYQKGELSPVAFKGIRVSHGVYEQRKPETHMVRIRCGAGGITPSQMEAVGRLAAKYGSGEIHVTTRQEMQLHYVDLKDVITVYDRLVEIGLSSRGGGGNTIRNILAPHDSGVAADEMFDVAPYAMALTTRMIAEADSWNLPRKFKIAFSNGPRDTIRATLTCLGFIAKMQGEQKGFAVYCAGGMGAKPMPGKLLFEFVPEDRVYYIAKAMKLMFDRYGNRRRRNFARLKFLWDKLGEFDFRNKFYEAYDSISGQEDLALVLPEVVNRSEVASDLDPEKAAGEAFETWKRRYAAGQKQAGLFHITVPLKLGDIRGEDAVRIAQVMSRFGNNCMRFSVFQNLHLRNIPESHLGNVYHLLRSIESLSMEPAMFGSMIACTGADTCKLGIALPRGATPRIQEILKQSGLDLDAIGDVKIHISGCPNTCGCHHAADLGFFGKVMRSGKDMMPAYNVLIGAILEEGKTRFSRMVGEVAAKDLPALIKDILAGYRDHRNQYDNFTAYADGLGEGHIRRACEAYAAIPSFEEKSEYFYDWGSADRFTLLKGQKAECSAGMFDMIDVDGKAARDGLMKAEASDDTEVKQEALAASLFASCRMLLVTRGLEPKNDEQVYDLFLQHFIRTDLVPSRFADLVAAGKAKDMNRILELKDQVAHLSDHLQKLYKSMDDSLRFSNETKGIPV